ncbi:MAG: ChbG/HpnK family deacetylase [Candidatus Omnitrophota bacterium]
MSRFLIVNADDFGLCAEITTGIIKAHTDGIVTAASIAANGRYLKEGIALLKNTGLDPGVHLTLVGKEKPVSGPISGLVDAEGYFLANYRKVIARILSGRFDETALRKELFSQVGLIRNYGINPTHLDSHQHLHLLPAVRNIALEIAKKFNLKWIRLPSANPAGFQEIGLNLLSRSLKSRAQQQKLRFTDSFLGFQERGRINEERLALMLRRLKSGLTELMVHPGHDASGKYDWGYHWKDEFQALTSERIKGIIKEQGITLTNFVGN